MTREEKIKSIAATIRAEINMLLSDYYGDEIFASDGADYERKALAHSRARAIDWLQERWRADAKASEERLEGVAEAVLEKLEELSTAK